MDHLLLTPLVWRHDRLGRRDGARQRELLAAGLDLASADGPGLGHCELSVGLVSEQTQRDQIHGQNPRLLGSGCGDSELEVF